MSDVTRVLAAIQRGEGVLPLVYRELQQLVRAKMAREQRGKRCKPPTSRRWPPARISKSSTRPTPRSPIWRSCAVAS